MAYGVERISMNHPNNYLALKEAKGMPEQIISFIFPLCGVASDKQFYSWANLWQPAWLTEKWYQGPDGNADGGLGHLYQMPHHLMDHKLWVKSLLLASHEMIVTAPAVALLPSPVIDLAVPPLYLP